jgi:hypothetical protein
LVGRPAVGGLEFVAPVRKLVQGKAKGSRYSVSYVPGGIGDAALKSANGRCVEIGSIG